MSNEKRIATVTAAVTTLVQTAVETLGLTPAPMVAPRNLENAGDHALVAVHLHRISTNDSLRNIGPGVHRGDAEVSTNPRVALDLHYLVAFRADSELDAQRMLAVSAAAIGTVAMLAHTVVKCAITFVATRTTTTTATSIHAFERHVRLPADVYTSAV